MMVSILEKASLKEITDEFPVKRNALKKRDKRKNLCPSNINQDRGLK